MLNKIVIVVLFFIANIYATEQDRLIINSQEEWTSSIEKVSSIEFKNGFATPSSKYSSLTSSLKTFKNPRSIKSISITQSPLWQNWEPVSNIGPENLGDAPVMISIEKGNYWLFGYYVNPRSPRYKVGKDFKSVPSKLDGFDIPLM